MGGRLIDGKAIAAEIRAELAKRVPSLTAARRRPGLAVIIAGEDAASRVYVRNKVRACEEIGIRSEAHEFPGTVPEAALLERIHALNADPAVHGILIQLPMPDGIDAGRVLAAVSAAKDVDGFHDANLGALVSGKPRFVPCTPAGIIELLKRSGVPIAGRRAVVIGRSVIVGKPMALLLLENNATVTICHSKTADLASLTREADVLVVAAGKPRMVTAAMVKPGACVIDVGIHRGADGKLAGDVAFDEVAPIAGWITPVPGGVGPMTIAMLMVATVRAAETAASP
jgi:methylenetetrahydrofolate dehydrogenase (NADP+)/methenyltetrahydrofolate cyclohydrolase